MSNTSELSFTMQGANNAAFKLPSDFLEANVPLPVIWDFHLKNSAEHPLFVYPGDGESTETITWGDAVKAMHRAGRIIDTQLRSTGIVNNFATGGKPPVVAILANLDSVTYWALLTGVIRAGYTPFLISTKNSSIAVAHLLKVTKSNVLYTSSDASVSNLAKETFEKMDPMTSFTVPSFDDLYLPSEAEFEPLPPFPEVDMESPAMIAHSSGSTSFPKPITLTHRVFIQWTLTPSLSGSDFCGKRFSVAPLPMYHTMGFGSTMNWASGSGMVLAVFNPKNPPAIVDSSVTLAHAVSIKCNFMLVVPSFIEEYCRSPESINALKTFDKIFWGGGPLHEQSGDMLYENGIPVGSFYGATECGCLVIIDTRDNGKDWNWVQLDPLKKFHLEPTSDGLYELFVIDTERGRLCVTNTEINGERAYETNDLLLRHPTNENLWAVYGRNDDQIMHSTGEKTNPGPMEDIISRHPSVNGCLIFGRGQFQAGALIEPIEDKRFDPTDEKKLAEFRNEVWSSMEEANNFAPKHSKIFKEMIMVTNPMKPFLFTPKRTIRRQLMLKDYATEIADLYKAVEASSNSDIALPSSWSVKDSTVFAKNVVQKVIGRNVNDEQDIFQIGADSLAATSIRNTILRAFRDSSINSSNISQNIVYRNPTIRMLGQVISDMASAGPEGSKASAEKALIKLMEDMVRDFTKDFPARQPSLPVPEQESVLVTGTTGSLGSHLLHVLINTPSVARVFTLNRPDRSGKASPKERQTKAFLEHGLDVSLLESPKLVLLEGDTSLGDFGLPRAVLEDMARSVTSVIHNAWRVDFNLALSSFRPLIVGVRNLVDWALNSPLQQAPKIVFTSSIATTSGWTEDRAVPEEVLSDPHIAVGGGYGESKWVAEQILDIVAKNTDLSTIVVRVGQVCGSRTNGSWNQWEWFPAIVQSYKVAGCLPDSTGVITWVPTDIAAAAIVDMRTAPTGFLHMVHPKPVTMSSIVKPMAKILDVPAVPYADWLEKLEYALKTLSSSGSGSSMEAVRENPSFKLIEFYRSIKSVSDSNEAFIMTRLAVEKTVKVCATLGDPDLRVLDESDARRWLKYWEEKGVVEFH